MKNTGTFVQNFCHDMNEHFAIKFDVEVIYDGKYYSCKVNYFDLYFSTTSKKSIRSIAIGMIEGWLGFAFDFMEGRLPYFQFNKEMFDKNKDE